MFAHDNLWVIGDTALNGNHRTLQSMKNARSRLNKPQMFLNNKYNVSCHYPGLLPAIRNPYARLFNQLAKALNVDELLPKVIIITPEKALIDYINFYSFGISSIPDSTVGWLVSRINRQVDNRFQKLAEIKLGAVQEGEPCLMWLKIMNTPSHEKCFTLRAKFNAILEERLSQIKGNYIMDFDQEFLNQRNFFDRLGKLNEHGKEQFWRVMDTQLKRFSRH